MPPVLQDQVKKPIRKSVRGEQKRQQILAAATKVFLKQGYLGTSMDQVAQAAAASKQTIYKHFGDKEELFKDVIKEMTGQVDRQIDELVQTLLAEADGDITTAFEKFALNVALTVTPPELLAVRRLVIANVNRFPEVGPTYYESGALRIQTTIAHGFEKLAVRGLLQFNDALKAAHQFYWLVLASPINTAMLHSDTYRLRQKERQEDAEAGARVFLAAYGRVRH